MNVPLAIQVIKSLQSTSDQTIVKLPTMGGSPPLNEIRTATGAPCIVVPIVNSDDNQHDENENLPLSNLFTGIESIVAMMEMK